MSEGFLTAHQRRHLRVQLHQTHDARLYRRTLALLQVDAGATVTDVANALEVTRQSIHNWLDAFRRDPNPQVLADTPRSGRPSVWTDDLQQLLRRALEQRPEAWDYQAMNWTVPLLQDFLATHGGTAVSEASLRRQMHARKRVGKRFRYVLEPDPKREKKRQILRRLRQLPQRSVVLTEDETDLRLFPPLRSGWAVRGQPAPVPISGGNAKRVLFGAINLWTGHRRLLPRRRQCGEDFQVFLEQVPWQWRSWEVVHLLDEDSSHTAGDSQETADDLEIELLWLPKRSPHLNPRDHLWRTTQAVVTPRWPSRNFGWAGPGVGG